MKSVVKNTNPGMAGQNIILPEVGEVQLAADCTVEVPSHIAEALITSSDWVNPLAATYGDPQAVLISLNEMNLESLMELAQEYPASEWEKRRNSDLMMRGYIFQKLTGRKITDFITPEKTDVEDEVKPVLDGGGDKEDEKAEVKADKKARAASNVSVKGQDRESAV